MSQLDNDNRKSSPLNNYNDVEDNIIKEEKPEAPIIEYGINAPQIDRAVGVTGKQDTVVPAEGMSTKTVLFRHTLGDGNGLKDITGFGFTPVGFTTFAYARSVENPPATSQSAYAENIGQVLGYNLAEGESRGANVYFIYIRQGDGTYSRANFDSFITDGIRINMTDQFVDFDVLITAYGYVTNT